MHIANIEIKNPNGISVRNITDTELAFLEKTMRDVRSLANTLGSYLELLEFCRNHGFPHADASVSKNNSYPLFGRDFTEINDMDRVVGFFFEEDSFFVSKYLTREQIRDYYSSDRKNMRDCEVDWKQLYDLLLKAGRELKNWMWPLIEDLDRIVRSLQYHLNFLSYCDRNGILIKNRRMPDEFFIPKPQPKSTEKNDIEKLTEFFSDQTSLLREKLPKEALERFDVPTPERISNILENPLKNEA